MWNPRINNTIRILLDLVGFVGAVFFPAWVPAGVIVLLSVRFRAWEAIFLGFLMDMLWSPGGFPWWTVLSIMVVWLLEPLRSAFIGE